MCRGGGGGGGTRQSKNMKFNEVYSSFLLYLNMSSLVLQGRNARYFTFQYPFTVLSDSKK